MITEIRFQNVTEQEQKCVERLILSRRRNPGVDGQMRKIGVNILERQLAERLMFQIDLKLSRLIGIGLASSSGIMTRFDLPAQPVDNDLVPFRRYGPFQGPPFVVLLSESSCCSRRVCLFC